MTEHQINQLKSILSDSKLGPNSAELDERILQAAKQQQHQVRTAKPSLFSLTYLQPAIFAVVITVCTFIGMGYVVSNKNEANLAFEPSPDLKMENTPVLEVIEPISRPNRIEVTKRPVLSKQAMDQILLALELPDSSELIAEMEFSVDVDQSQVAENLYLALSDIREMIHMGELDDARERYAQLRESCDDCDLPGSLEALVLSSQERNRSASSDTG